MSMVVLIIKIVIAVIIGGGVGVILSLGIWTKQLSKSNVMGENLARFDDYATKILYVYSKNDVHRDNCSKFLRYYGREILREKGYEAPDMSYMDEEFPDDEHLPEVDIPLFKPLE